jgi:hypothetical protein
MLEVTIYKEVNDDDPVVYDGVDFLSLISDETYGPPALVAPKEGGRQPVARPGDKVLYINTKFVPMFEVMRMGDED